MVPHFLFRDGCAVTGDPGELSPDWGFDFYLFPEKCRRKPRIRAGGVPVYFMKTPQGWGHEAAVEWGASLDRLLGEMDAQGKGIAAAGELQEITGRYDALRRIVRAISLARMENPAVMGYGDLLDLYECCLSLPPDLVSGYCAEILEGIRAADPADPGKRVKVLISSGPSVSRDVVQGIEDEGCLIVWDDACPGGRGFDLSYSGESGDLPA